MTLNSESALGLQWAQVHGFGGGTLHTLAKYILWLIIPERS